MDAIRRPSFVLVAAMAMLAAVGVWLWPLGLGGRMPVGGDVTSFSIGLMAFLHDSLHAGRWPVWNDLWGYGFPGLAESQMGVYYPPHLVLYRLFPVEAAYTASLVLHTGWAALGAWWAARRFGTSALGASVAGFAWATCGFFLIHLPHQWGYTTGCWMPWAWGLAWRAARGDGTRRTPLLLAIVLTLQVLPGHFQLAFCTQAGVLIIAFWTFGEQCAVRTLRIAGPFGVIVAVFAVMPLGAAQLWPTLRLARLAATQRSVQYLSEFASTPFHLVSYVAPRLFHGSALWRPLVWDPFRTSPEEHLAYIGLAPLFLAVVALVCLRRWDPGIRVLAALALATLVLSLGPYMPGFGLLCRLPGFSFFRGPSRWSLATSLALALLAGRGLDAIGEIARPGRALARFALGAALIVALGVGLVELAMSATEGRGWPLAIKAFDRVFRVWPWPDPPRIQSLGRRARAHQPDLLLSYARDEARAGRAVNLLSARPRFADERQRIYGRELGGTIALLGTLVLIAAMTRRTERLKAGLIAATLVDLWMLGRQRPIDIAPLRSLKSQSPVLARLAEETRGTRIVCPAHNLAMIAGVAPLEAYRTLDLAALPTLTRLASSPLPGLERRVALRATGTALRVADPFEVRAVASPTGESISDPALASWMFGAELVAVQPPWLARFVVSKPDQAATRAWCVPLTKGRDAAMLDVPERDLGAILSLFEPAMPLAWRTPRPGRLEVDLEAKGREIVVIAQLADPQWRALWIGSHGTRSAAIRPAFRAKGQGGWQAVEVPEPGTWTLRLDYDARDVRQGLAVSGVAWLSLIVAFAFAGRMGKSRSHEGRGT